MKLTPIILIVCFVTAPAAADFFNNATGLADPLVTVTFDNPVLPRITQVRMQYEHLGVTFTPYLWYDVILADFPNVTGHRVGNSAVGDLQDPFSIHFTQPHTSAALALGANDSNFTFTALLNGSVVQTETVFYESFQAESFYGFTGIEFDEIRVSQQVLSGTAGVLVDNIQLGPTTCPADFDGDGFLTGLDFDAYVSAFEAGDASSDFDGDGFVTGLDFDAYVAAFEAGC